MEPAYKRLTPDSRFYNTGKPCKYGHMADRYMSNNECVECRRIKNVSLKEKQVAWWEQNRDRKNAVGRTRYIANVEAERERTRRKYATNKDKVTATNNAWVEKNPGIKNHYCAKRRAAIRKQVPLWADMEAIKQMYRNCPNGYHVDHIIPIQGKTVCGFHSQHNLQYLPASENQRKFNRLEDQYVSFEW
jgi:hypothetical protein